MPSPTTTLQRIRFCAISPDGYQNEPFFKTHFRREPWERLGRSCYWSQATSSAAALHDPDGITLPVGENLDSDSYFNAFFLGYWRKLTFVANVGLRLRFSGKVRIRVQAQTALTESVTLTEATVHHVEMAEWQVALPEEMLPADALRLSFCLTACSKTARLSGGEWFTTDIPARAPSVALVMPTYNRAHFARKTVASLLLDETAAALISRIVLIEQSDQAELEDLAGPKVSYLRQPNLGGAGGFSRGMFECVHKESMGELTHLLFLDDDIMIETDSVVRVLRMAAFAREDYVLGGGMLDLFRPHAAVALGEAMEVNDMGFYQLKQVYAKAEVSSGTTLNLASLPHSVGYCAWWFCLFPCKIVDSIGLPLPCFFRGDDVQWGARAKAVGFMPYLVPGIGVWHLPFQSKSVPWVTYFDRYNTLIGNTLHGLPHAERFFAYSLHEAKALLIHKQFAFAAATIMALEDYLRGWAHYRDRSFPAALGSLKAALVGYMVTDTAAASQARLRAAVEQLERRFNALSPAYTKMAARVGSEFVAQMPQVYTRQAWADYFVNGSMQALAAASADNLRPDAVAV